MASSQLVMVISQLNYTLSLEVIFRVEEGILSTFEIEMYSESSDRQIPPLKISNLQWCWLRSFSNGVPNGVWRGRQDVGSTDQGEVKPQEEIEHRKIMRLTNVDLTWKRDLR